MNLQAQRDLSIAGDVVGRDKITVNITRGLDELPTRYDGRVQNFLEYYLGTKDHPAPFGGRASDLAALDAWLDDPAAPPYASLIAPAGRGKSALLAHWVTRLLSRSTINDQRQTTNDESIHVVYFPISIRFNTNLETVVFASLAARIAHVFGEKVTYTPDTNQYRGVFSDYVRRTPPDGGRVLVVVDGLDEAAGWEAGADLFPTVAPGHLRVIVAARPLALDKDETAWLNRLGWEMPNRAQRLSLAGLDREGVRDVLSQMGNPLDALATKIDLISRLYELSAGDPLLVRLYVEALLPHGAQAATLTPDDLAKLQPGLEAYFKRWFEEQQKLWGGAKPLHDKTVRGLLNLCATALGPLKKDDVLALAPDIFEDSGLLDEAAQAVNRFIIGDGFNSGYVFSHPRLAEYFAAKLAERERQAWQARFLQYGRDTLTALENKTLLPQNAPAYVVQYYGAHLAQAKAPATDFYALVCESWLRAWEWLEGTPAGFLNDADRAWQKAEAEGTTALGQQIRAALCFASVTSLSANIPKDLLVACVKAGVISPALGLVMARQKPDLRERAGCLAAIAEFHPSEFDAIMREALAAARAIFNEGSRADVLEELAPRLPKNLIDEALSAAREMHHERFCAQLLGKLAWQLPSRQQMEVLEEALSVSRKIFNEASRAYVLGELAQQLPVHKLAEVLGEALSGVRAISHEESRAYLLEELTPCLPESLLREALATARAISDERYRAQVLGAMASRLSPPELKEVLDEAVAAARTISDEVSRSKVLVTIASRLLQPEQKEVLDEALAAARTISDEVSRSEVLVAIATRLSLSEQKEVLDEALAAARTISDEVSRSEVLVAIASRLPQPEQTEVLKEALAAARIISHAFSGQFVLSELAQRLPVNLIGEALSLTHKISSESYRAMVLAVLASRLIEREQADLLREALSLTRKICDESYRAEFLAVLASHFTEYEQTNVWKEAFCAASAISYEESRAHLLEKLTPCLPESLLREALATARAISDERYRAQVLGAMASRLSPPEQKEVLDEALATIRTIADERSRALGLALLATDLPKHEQTSVLGEALSVVQTISNKSFPAHERNGVSVLADVVQRLPESLLREAFEVTRKISNEKSRAQVLKELAPRLPKSLLGDALTTARAISDEWHRARLLVEIALRLPKRDQAVVFAETLSAARAISNEESRAHVLEELASRLPESLLGDVLAAARAISNERSRAEVLGAMVSRLSQPEQKEVLDEALSAARAISNEESRAHVLEELASRLPEREQVEVLDEALLATRAISDERYRTIALWDLALRLPEHEQAKVFGEALAAAPHAIFDESLLVQRLERSIPRLSENLLKEALQMARTLCHQDGSLAVLSSLAPRWSAVCRSTQRSEFEELSATLRAFAHNERPQLLQAIQALFPVIAEQGGEPALRETARAIVDTAKWWP